MTFTKTEIHKVLRQLERNERDKEGDITVAYQKIIINNKTYSWKEIEREL